MAPGRCRLGPSSRGCGVARQLWSQICAAWMARRAKVSASPVAAPAKTAASRSCRVPFSAREDLEQDFCVFVMEQRLRFCPVQVSCRCQIMR